MCIHVVGESRAKIAAVCAMLKPRYSVTSEIISGAAMRDRKIEAVVVAADIRIVENISALKRLSRRLGQIPKRVFLIDQKTRLSVVQAYALGATHVLTNPVTDTLLLSKLADYDPLEDAPYANASCAQEAAMAGAASIASMFSAVSTGYPIDVGDVKNAGRKIADSIAQDGLSDWLTTVRRHHEGTYQHCLLVTGTAVAFGLSLGLRRADMERLYSAAMFHDVGKAKIPLAILDKPGRLDAGERKLIEAHPVTGYDALKGNEGISPEILDSVRHHHEYLDGSGYPDGLCAQNLSDIVRILTISDIFAALIEQRTYKPTMPREQAYEILQGMNGKLELALVSAFRDVALIR